MTDLQKRFPYIRMTDEEASYILECANISGLIITNPYVIESALALIRMSPEERRGLHLELKKIIRQLAN